MSEEADALMAAQLAAGDFSLRVRKAVAYTSQQKHPKPTLKRSSSEETTALTSAKKVPLALYFTVSLFFFRKAPVDRSLR